MSVNRAWREFTTGNPETVIAYVEAGINWRDSNAVKELANKVYLNAGELPAPTTPAQGDAACGAGVLCAADFSDTQDSNGNGAVDPEDLIVRYSDRTDDDGNGYVDDISGWDFYDDQNDPATSDSSYAHANNQMERAAGETNNGDGGRGRLPALPVAADQGRRRGARPHRRPGRGVAVRRRRRRVGDRLGHGRPRLLDLHAPGRRVRVAARGGGGGRLERLRLHRPPGRDVPPARAAGQRHGGEPAELRAAEQHAPRTYRERSAITSWGAHNVFTVATNSGTTSASTPTLGGAVGLVTAYSRQAASEGKIPRALSAQEAVQVMKATASDVNDPSLALAEQAGLGPAVRLRPAQRASRRCRRSPPATCRRSAFIDSPDWFTFEDPERTPRVAVAGRIDASRSSGYTWKLEAGLGGEPSDDQFTQVAGGSGSAPREGELGPGRPRAARLAGREGAVHALRAQGARDHRALHGHAAPARDRRSGARGRGPPRVLRTPRRQPAARLPQAHRPRRRGPGGAGRPHGLGAAGHRLRRHRRPGARDRPRERRRAPRLPRQAPSRRRCSGATRAWRPGNEPIVTNVAVGDLDGTGALKIVGTTTTGRTYIWGERGRRRAGWPKTLDTGVVPAPIPRPRPREDAQACPRRLRRARAARHERRRQARDHPGGRGTAACTCSAATAVSCRASR